jgi:hypothetical protein
MSVPFFAYSPFVGVKGEHWSNLASSPNTLASKTRPNARQLS